jgi:hypothetical protein
MTEHTESPHNQNEESESKKENTAIDHYLGTPWQPSDEKFYLDMPAENQRHAGSEGDGRCLGEHHDVKGTQDRPKKDLGPHDIDAGNNHHYQQPSKPYPLKPTA